MCFSRLRALLGLSAGSAARFKYTAICSLVLRGIGATESFFLTHSCRLAVVMPSDIWQPARPFNFCQQWGLRVRLALAGLRLWGADLERCTLPFVCIRLILKLSRRGGGGGPIGGRGPVRILLEGPVGCFVFSW